jgi:hypothetical protein
VPCLGSEPEDDTAEHERKDREDEWRYRVAGKRKVTGVGLRGSRGRRAGHCVVTGTSLAASASLAARVGLILIQGGHLGAGSRDHD